MRKGNVITLQELSQHVRRDDAWVSINGCVYNITDFMRSHPGGFKSLLKYAGKDATAIFNEIHDYSLLQNIKKYLVGRISSASHSVTSKFHKAPALEKLVQNSPKHPFPHNTYENTYPATRFQWCRLKRHLNVEAANDECLPVLQKSKSEDNILRRMKTNLAVLHDCNRDWLHISCPKTYASVMSLKFRAIQERRHLVYCADPSSIQAQEEVLKKVLKFLLSQYSKRFQIDSTNSYVMTLTPGYKRKFCIRDYAQCPLLLASCLIEEDLYLVEKIAIESSDYDQPSDCEFRVIAGSSCFSFDINAKFRSSLKEIHHPHVPGFERHLQRHVHRFFSFLSKGKIWWRDNWQITPYPCYVHPDLPLASFVQEQGSKFTFENTSNHTHGLHDNLVSRCFWRAEFQTIQKLKTHESSLFTVHTYIEPMSSAVLNPAIAASLSCAIRRKYKGMLHYMHIGQASRLRRILNFLDETVKCQVEMPLIDPNILPEPWNRKSLEDGTFASKAEDGNCKRQKHTSISKL